MELNSALVDVADYYSDKLLTYGDEPLGVDWNGPEGQILRFDQLMKIFKASSLSSSFTVNDLGCGYGAFLDYMLEKSLQPTYYGYDISQKMIEAAKLRHANVANSYFYLSSKPDLSSDYTIASGIFNVRLNSSEDDWWVYVMGVLDEMFNASQIGFAFNFLTTYSDVEKRRNHLFYANPSHVFDFCKLRYSRNVALLHNYDLYEFTILVHR